MSKEDEDFLDLDTDLGNEEEFEFEVVAPEVEDEEPVIASADDDLNDEDIAKYSDGARKRIEGLLRKEREARERADAAARERDEAVAFGRSQYDRAQKLATEGKGAKKNLVETSKAALVAKKTDLKAKYKAAFDDGDGETLANIQAEMADLAIEERQLAYVEQDLEQTGNEEESLPETKPKEFKPTAGQQKWVNDNPWFSSQSDEDKELQAVALTVSSKLIEKEKIDPRTDEALYFKRLDEELRKRPAFKEVFKSRGKPTKDASVVAPPHRDNSGGKQRQKVELTREEVRIAKRLGVSNKDFAREKWKIANAQEG